MHYFYSKVNRGHVDCPMYRGGPYLGEYVMGGSTLIIITSVMQGLLWGEPELERALSRSRY